MPTLNTAQFILYFTVCSISYCLYTVDICIFAALLTLVDKARQFRELLGTYCRERAAYHRAIAARYEQAARLFSPT